MKIVIHSDEPRPLAEQLQADHEDIEVLTCNTYDGLSSVLDTFRPDIVYSIRFAGTHGFPAEALKGKNGPGWIHVGGSGTDHLGEWDGNKLTVTNSAGVAAGMMAEYAFGGFLQFSLDLPGLNSDKNAKAWNSRRVAPLAGKTLLIIGLGNTGRAIAKLGKAFGMRVIGTRARPMETENVDEVYPSRDLLMYLPKADFIAVCVPLRASTQCLLDENAFDVVKSGVVLVDVSRGGVIVEQALLNALESGKVAGAVLDVFEKEPLPTDNPLWEVENVIISPHCSSVYDGWEVASLKMFSENLSRWKEGKELVNLVTP